MNKRLKEFKKNRLLQYLDFNSRSGNKEGYVKIHSHNSQSHETTKWFLCLKLKQQGFKIYTEVKFYNKQGIADIVAISQSGDGYIIEVLHSETDKRFNEKLERYPKEFKVISVKTDGFDINHWEL